MFGDVGAGNSNELAAGVVTGVVLNELLLKAIEESREASERFLQIGALKNDLAGHTLPDLQLGVEDTIVVVE